MIMDLLTLLKHGMCTKFTQPIKALANPQKSELCAPCEDRIEVKQKDDFFTPKPSDDDFFKN